MASLDLFRVFVAVYRTVYPVVPPHTEYELTPMGRELEAIVTSLAQWAHQHIDAVLAAHAEYDSRLS